MLGRIEMSSSSIRVALAATLLFSLLISVPGQGKPQATPVKEEQEIETLKIDTDLVTVPVIATDRNGVYITDLRKEDFIIQEDGVAQEVTFFGTVAKPFHVVLMLDTSASTRENLRQIQQAAFAFVQQLQPADRVKIISFDEQVRDLNEFTSDRETLRQAINSVRSGEGTKVYDAMEVALNTIRNVKGRKAIVLFSDAVDFHSDRATYESTVRWLDEEGVIVYPIRYDTRDATERIAREASGGLLPTREIINRPTDGSTAPTFPSNDPLPTSLPKPSTGPMGLPSADEIWRQKRERDRDRDRQRDERTGRVPSDDPAATVPPPIDNRGPVRVPGSTTQREPQVTVDNSRPRRRGPDDSITMQLDLLYDTADKYLEVLASKTGGRLMRADTLKSLPDAFGKIAAELRTQYLLGYYPINKQRDQRYRKIGVTAKRKDVVIRARPGYLATDTK